MSFAAIAGLGAGIVHALAGPDHVLGLLPLALGRARAWRLGLLWGIGHGAGTLCCALPVIALVSAASLQGLDRFAEVLGGAALVCMGIVGLRRRAAAAQGKGEGRGVFAVGLVHGASGGSALLLLPAAASASALQAVGYLVGMIVGSAVAMAAVTGALARISLAGAGAARWMGRLGSVAAVGSILLGSFWIVRWIA